MADINVSGRMKVKTLKEAFKKEFGVGLRVYKGKKFADDGDTLASIRSGDAKGGEFSVKGNMKVGNAEKRFKETFGISIQIEDGSGGLADDGLTLAAAGGAEAGQDGGKKAEAKPAASRKLKEAPAAVKETPKEKPPVKTGGKLKEQKAAPNADMSEAKLTEQQLASSQTPTSPPATEPLEEQPSGGFYTRHLNAAKKAAASLLGKQEDSPVSPAENVKDTPALKTPKPGATWTEPVTGMEFVWVPGGCYEMGDTFGDGHENERPVHEVCVDGFWLGKYPVTQGQWEKVMGNNPSHFKKGATHPVKQVSWNDAQEFLKKLNRLTTGRGFRLPTEAEWEYAARSGGKKEKYAGGNDVDKVAWYSDNRNGSTQPVGRKAANGLGLHDMSGNVYEWCEDVGDDKAYTRHSRKNPLITNGSVLRVLRGGAWNSRAWVVRAASRSRNAPDYRFRNFGFRVAALAQD